MKRASVVLAYVVSIAIAIFLTYSTLRYDVDDHARMPSSAFYIVVDNNQTIGTRIAVAESLDSRDREVARRILSNSLYGDLDRSAFDNIVILGVIGDESTLEDLESLRKRCASMRGDWNGEILESQSRIRKNATGWPWTCVPSK